MGDHYQYNNFPTWNYGYTLGPPSSSNAGNYTTFVDPAYLESDQNGEAKEDLGDKKKCDENMCLSLFPPGMFSLCCSRAVVVGGSRTFSLLRWVRVHKK